MIYSKFGSQLTLVSKHEALNGQLSIQATAGDAPEVREYGISDLKADGGLTEINEAVARLPMKIIVGKKAQRSQQIRF
jgi:hypothetical protein